MLGCCNCGESVELGDTKVIVCPDCGGFCCNEGCLDEHECDEEGDM